MRYININDIVKQNNCHEGLDTEFNSLILDEEKLLSTLSPLLTSQENDPNNKGMIIDYHSVDFFHEEWIDLIVVLRTKTELLYDRLVERGYNEKKIGENMECEIMQVVLDECKVAFGGEDGSCDRGIVMVELGSDTEGDLEGNVGRILMWIDQWREDRGYLDCKVKRTRT